MTKTLREMLSDRPTYVVAFLGESSIPHVVAPADDADEISAQIDEAASYAPDDEAADVVRSELREGLRQVAPVTAEEIEELDIDRQLAGARGLAPEGYADLAYLAA